MDTPEIISAYLDVLRSQGYSASAVYQRGRLLAALGVPPDQAARADVLRVLSRAEKASTRRVYLNQLRNAFRDLRELGLVDHDPTYGLKTPAPARSKPRPLTAAEIDALAGMPVRERAWTTLGLRAGLRASEVVAVQASDLIDTDLGLVLRVPHGKGGLDWTIPAHPDVVDLLVSFTAVTGRIWRINGGTMSQAWSKAAREVGVEGRRFHDLRHTYATQLYQQTGDLYVTQQLMRHASIATTTIYAKPDESRAFAAVSGL